LPDSNIATSGLFGVMKLANFHEDLALESRFYRVVKKHYNEKGCDCVFLHYNGGKSMLEAMQRKHDIDVIVDDGIKNTTLSLKATRKPYPSIFFETISNCTTGTHGWGLDSEADEVCYGMQVDGNWFLLFFKLQQLRDIYRRYPAYRSCTKNNKGEVLYETEGHPIPLSAFKKRIVKIEQ